MAQLKDGTVVNGSITATSFNGNATTATSYYINEISKSSVDLNSYSNSGVYKFTNATSVSNGPSGLGSTFTIVVDDIFQTLMTTTNVFRRIRSSSSSWLKIL